MPLANPVVARLAAGEAVENEYCGLLLVCADACSGNSPAPHQAKMAAMRDSLAAEGLPASAYVYPPSTVHCTVATLRPFTAGPLDKEARNVKAQKWREIFAAARSSPDWPATPLVLRMGPPLLQGAAGTVRYEDLTGGVDAMRRCLREALLAAGAVPAEGGADRSQAKALPGEPAGEPPPHIPDIVHSTVLRWSAEPSEAERAAAAAAVERVAAAWEPVEITVTQVSAVFEHVPFMHVPVHGTPAFAHDEQIFWQGAVSGSS